MPLPKVKLYLRRAWFKTRSDFDWKAVMKSLAAASAGSILAVLGLIQDSPRKVLVVLVAGLLAALFSLLFSFLGNLARAPKEVRRSYSADAGKHGAMAIGTVEIRASDIMQQEAAVVANLIEKYLQLKERRGEAELSKELYEIRQYIEYFGKRAQTDEWITRKSRRRSLRLYQEILASDDLRLTQQRCRDFVKLRPSF